jgi:hypothetical protein
MVPLYIFFRSIYCTAWYLFFELIALNGESATNLAYPLRSSARTAAPAVLGPCELFLLFNALVAQESLRPHCAKRPAQRRVCLDVSRKNWLGLFIP